MSAQLTVAEQLIRSANIIDHNGHTKDDFFNRSWPGTPATAPVCAVGAILVAVTGSPIDISPEALPVLRAVSAALPGEPPAGPDGELDNLVEHIAPWNDRPERTAAEVSAFLRGVAVAA